MANTTAPLGAVAFIIPSLGKGITTRWDDLDKVEKYAKKQDLLNTNTTNKINELITNTQTNAAALRIRTTNLEVEKDLLKGRATDLETEKDLLKGRATNLETEKDLLKDRATNLEIERDILKERATDLEKKTDDLGVYINKKTAETEDNYKLIHDDYSFIRQNHEKINDKITNLTIESVNNVKNLEAISSTLKQQEATTLNKLSAIDETLKKEIISFEKKHYDSNAVLSQHNTLLIEHERKIGQNNSEINSQKKLIESNSKIYDMHSQNYNDQKIRVESHSTTLSDVRENIAKVGGSVEVINSKLDPLCTFFHKISDNLIKLDLDIQCTVKDASKETKNALENMNQIKEEVLQIKKDILNAENRLSSFLDLVEKIEVFKTEINELRLENINKDFTIEQLKLKLDEHDKFIGIFKEFMNKRESIQMPLSSVISNVAKENLALEASKALTDSEILINSMMNSGSYQNNIQQSLIDSMNRNSQDNSNVFRNSSENIFPPQSKLENSLVERKEISSLEISKQI